MKYALAHSVQNIYGIKKLAFEVILCWVTSYRLWSSLNSELLGHYGEVTMSTRFFEFVGGDTGIWRVVKTNTLVGESLLEVSRLDIASDSNIKSRSDASWVLRGITSNERYVIREEKNELASKQQGIGRPEATCAALIPIRKNENWWALTQDERRSIFEEHSNHIKIGLHYLPAVARRLHHCRDLRKTSHSISLLGLSLLPLMKLNSIRCLLNCAPLRNGSI